MFRLSLSANVINRLTIGVKFDSKTYDVSCVAKVTRLVGIYHLSDEGLKKVQGSGGEELQSRNE